LVDGNFGGFDFTLPCAGNETYDKWIALGFDQMTGALPSKLIGKQEEQNNESI